MNIIKEIKELFVPKWLDWKEYSNRIEWLDGFHFQQRTREESIANSKGVGKSE